MHVLATFNPPPPPPPHTSIAWRLGFVVSGGACYVSQWGAWTACSADCGGGTQDRSRTIVQLPSTGFDCPPLTEQQTCNEEPCVDRACTCTPRVALPVSPCASNPSPVLLLLRSCLCGRRRPRGSSWWRGRHSRHVRRRNPWRPAAGDVLQLPVGGAVRRRRDAAGVVQLDPARRH